MGTWAEDLGAAIEWAFKALVFFAILTPVLIGVIIYLLVTR